MTTQTSRLEIIIDTTKGKKGTDDLTKSLESVEKQGDKTEKSAKQTSKAISGTGKTSKEAAPKIKETASAIEKVGDEAEQSTNKVSSFRGELSKAASDGKFGGAIQGLTSKLGEFRAGGLLAAAAVGGAVVGGVALAAGAITKIAFEAAQANVELLQFATIAGTTTQQFQGLAGAAATFGISQEKLSDQLKDFNEKIGEFNSIGAGGAVDFFEQIAVKTEGGAEGAKKLAEEMSKMDGIDALQTYVDKLEEAGVNQKEMSFYLESMGSDLTALAPLLANGGQLWKDYQSAMEEAGIITGQEAIETSIELAAQQESLQMRFGALRSELASQVMPVLSEIINAFMSGSDNGNRFGGVLDAVGVIARGVGVVIIGLATGIKNLVSIMSLAINQMKTIGSTAVAFANADGIKAKGAALLSGAKDFAYGNAVKAGKEIHSNTKSGMAGIGNLVTGQKGQYDALTKSIINNRKAQLEWNKTQSKGLGGGAQQNKNLFPTAKSSGGSGGAKGRKSGVSSSAANEAKRLAEQQKREAERLQQEIERAKERVIREYASKEEKLLLEYNDSKAEIQKAFANDPTNLNLYLNKAKDTYEKEVAAYRSAQKDKLESFRRDFADKIADASSEIALLRTENRFGRDSYQYQSASISARTNSSRRDEMDSYNRDVAEINRDYDPVADAEEHYALMEQAKQAHVLRMQAIDAEHAVASQALIMQQRNMQIDAFSGLTGSLMGLVDESSTAYAALFAVQKSLNFAQAVMNGYTAISAAWASAPFPYNMPAVAMATVQSGVLQAAIQAVTPAFANGGLVRGPGTGTSDSINARLSNGEFVMTAEATKRVGPDTLNAINKGKDLSSVQSANPQPIENKVQVGIFDDRSDMLDQMRGREGEKIVMYHLRRNGMVRA